jgi:hypothetical protein
VPPGTPDAVMAQMGREKKKKTNSLYLINIIPEIAFPFSNI